MKHNFEGNFIFPTAQSKREDIVAILEKYSITLDETTLDFIVKYNGCKFKEEGKQWLINKEGKNSLFCFNSIVELELIENRMIYDKQFESDYHYYFVDCLINIMLSSSSSGMICIGYAGEHKGKIYNLEYQDYDEDEGYSSMLDYLGDSLEDVFSRLITYDELPEEWK